MADTQPDEAKPLSASDMDAEDLAKAIEESVAHEMKPAKPGPKTAKSAPAAKTSPTAKAKNEDKGVPIIVKRRSGYVAPPTSAASGSPPADESAKPLEPPSKTQKTIDPAPASQSNNTVTKPQEAEVEAEVDKAEPPAANDSDQPAQTPDSKPAESESDQPAPPIDTKAVPGTVDPTDKPQKPTVFDTSEYHLPIKARNRNYVNSAVSWIILLLVLAGAAGYVLYRLGILEFGDLNLLSR